MSNLTHQDVSNDSNPTSLWGRFIKWCEGQEVNRIGWSAGMLVAHGTVITIITMLVVVATGNHFIFWPIAIIAMGACLITSLSAMPTKITIPVFFISVLVDLAIIIASFAIAAI
ncbi:MAG: hypothetical protein JST23_07230 [Bacteroidetes bacterium]|nr:hypothetical protein [Bacteroidota bacterium]